MESGCRISNFLRVYDPGCRLKFRLGPHIIRGAFFRQPFPAREKRWEGFRACCSQASNQKTRFLKDCSSRQEDDKEPPFEEHCPVTGGVVALGKFDALHIGHRELAVQASKAGPPFLLSFVGMAEVLGWEPRAPVVAKCDRKRVLSSWAPYCGNVVPVEFHVDFSSVRHLTPQQFVEKLSKEFRVSGVVAGENYRFGYRAAGNASELVRLCNEYGLGSYIVRSVMDINQCSSGVINKPGDKERGQVSSTRVRHCLATGDMKYVSELLGRKHRLVLMISKEFVVTESRISAPKECMLNQPPKEGVYYECTVLVDDVLVGECKATIDSCHIHVELDSGGSQKWASLGDCRLMGIEFGAPVAD